MSAVVPSSAAAHICRTPVVPLPQVQVEKDPRMACISHISRTLVRMTVQACISHMLVLLLGRPCICRSLLALRVVLVLGRTFHSLMALRWVRRIFRSRDLVVHICRILLMRALVRTSRTLVLLLEAAVAVPCTSHIPILRPVVVRTFRSPGALSVLVQAVLLPETRRARPVVLRVLAGGHGQKAYGHDSVHGFVGGGCGGFPRTGRRVLRRRPTYICQ